MNVAVVDSWIQTDFLGHGYFLTSPATSSDLILNLGYGRPIGKARGRPLTKVAPFYSTLDDDYPDQPAPNPDDSAAVGCVLADLHLDGTVADQDLQVSLDDWGE